MSVRLARMEDFPVVCRMARDFHQASEYRVIEFDEASCFLLFQSALSKGLVFVSEGRELTGFVLGLPFPCPLNQSKTMVSELAWWVDPQYRNTSAGMRLFQALEEAAKEYGSTSLTMICLESMEPDMVQGIYERKGYKAAERAFMRYF
jgi:GNAT superfamily N-acetyltransferase